jgi:DNA-binding response OmpR family regulator
VAAERILVIEDESGARTALARLLTEEGFSVRTAATGARGLEQIREFSPDTVVCDFRLPDTTGLQVLRAARAASPDKLTFIVVTADCGGAESEQALRREADFFFHKPVDLSTFYRVVGRGKGNSDA